MLEEIITNSFIGIEEKDNDFFIDAIDLKSNIKKLSINTLLSEIKELEPLKKTNNIGFCFDCQKNIADSKCSTHKVKYFKDIINKVNINGIEKQIETISEAYNDIINILQKKIKEFKKRNDNQIQLAKKIVEVYKNAVNSGNLSYQIIMNKKNILKYNPISINNIFPGNYQFNLEYNLLEAFPIDFYIDEKIKIENIQKITNIKYKKDKKNERVSYFLSFIKNNEIIGYQKNKIFSFNMKDYSKTCEIETNDNIIRLNLMKDNETIFAVFEKSIKKLKFEKNQIILENYLDGINVDNLGKIINYKDGIAWTNYQYIGFYSIDYY